MEKKQKTARAESARARSLNRAAQRIAAHGETSEKAIEAYLRRQVEQEGGICLKYSNPNQVGYPDRAVLMPGGATLWVELKSTGETPSKLQRERFRQMEAIGHSVAVLDSKEAVDGFMAVVRMAVFEAGCLLATDGLAPDSASTGAGCGALAEEMPGGLAPDGASTGAEDYVLSVGCARGAGETPTPQEGCTRGAGEAHARSGKGARYEV